jgi:hypothetical protein
MGIVAEAVAPTPGLVARVQVHAHAPPVRDVPPLQVCARTW